MIALTKRKVFYVQFSDRQLEVDRGNRQTASRPSHKPASPAPDGPIILPPGAPSLTWPGEKPGEGRYEVVHKLANRNRDVLIRTMKNVKSMNVRTSGPDKLILQGSKAQHKVFGKLLDAIRAKKGVRIKFPQSDVVFASEHGEKTIDNIQRYPSGFEDGGLVIDGGFAPPSDGFDEGAEDAIFDSEPDEDCPLADSFLDEPADSNEPLDDLFGGDDSPLDTSPTDDGLFEEQLAEDTLDFDTGRPQIEPRNPEPLDASPIEPSPKQSSPLLDDDFFLSEVNRFSDGDAKNTQQRIVALSRTMNPRNAELTYRLGVLAQKANDLNVARKAFQKAATLQPDHVPALAHLERVLRKLGEIDRAQKVAKHLAEVAPMAKITKDGELPLFAHEYQPNGKPLVELPAPDDLPRLLVAMKEAKNPANKDRAKRDVVRLVTEEFELRQKLQMQQLERLRTRLKQVELKFKQREAAREQIIQRRINELTKNPEKAARSKPPSRPRDQPSGLPLGGQPAMDAEIAKLQAQRNAMAQRFSERHPAVVSIDEQLKAAKSQQIAKSEMAKKLAKLDEEKARLEVQRHELELDRLRQLAEKHAVSSAELSNKEFEYQRAKIALKRAALLASGNQSIASEANAHLDVKTRKSLAMNKYEMALVTLQQMEKRLAIAQKSNESAASRNIAEAEFARAKLEVQRAKVVIDSLKKEVTEEAKDAAIKDAEIDVAIARNQLESSRAELSDAIDANEKVAGVVPKSRIRKLEFAVERDELLLKKAMQDAAKLPRGGR